MAVNTPHPDPLPAPFEAPRISRFEQPCRIVMPEGDEHDIYSAEAWEMSDGWMTIGIVALVILVFVAGVICGNLMA